jgi:hypothetical protein
MVPPAVASHTGLRQFSHRLWDKRPPAGPATSIPYALPSRATILSHSPPGGTRPADCGTSHARSAWMRVTTVGGPN